MRFPPTFLRSISPRFNTVFQRMTDKLSPASLTRRRRALAIAATVVLTLSVFGGYAAIASSSGHLTLVRQALNRAKQSFHLSESKPGVAGRISAANPSAIRTNPMMFEGISLTTLGSAYTQSFDTLSNTAGSTTSNLTITGWFMTETGGGARDNEQYAVDTGASTTGDTYSYGAAAATDRALGGLRSGTLIPNFGANFMNNTGSTIASLAVVYTGEEWRLGTTGRTDQINFEYSTNATNLVTGTWINVAALNFVTPDTATTGAKNGNAAADRTALSATITGLNIPNGASFWIRWTDIDATGADDGLAVDDFALTPNGSLLPTITAAGPLTRQQGSAAINSTIATVSDSSAGTLTVTATTVPTGITVNNIVNTSGTVTADVSADCTAATGANVVVLTVTNGTTTLSNTANLTVNVTANTPPALSYNSASTLAGNATTVNPATGPSDNGSLASIVLQSVTPSVDPGAITVDNSTGIVTVTEDVPAGIYTVTIRATDNCGAFTGSSFTLTVACVNSLTVNNLGDGADATPGNGVCETVTGNGICTLRAAIEESTALSACSPFTINFSVTGTINLLSELPWLEHPNLTIQGPGANLLTVTRSVVAAFTIFIVTGDVVTLNDLTVSNGNASGTFDYGGGIYNASQMLTINRCQLTSNSALQGGGVGNDGGDVFINNSTIRNNTAASEGAGVYQSSSEGSSAIILTNCTISGNTITGSGNPSTAGGLAQRAADGGTVNLTLLNCTVTNNDITSGGDAGGIFSGVDSDPDSTASVTLKNTIVAGNSNPQVLSAGSGSTITSQGNNLLSDGGGGFFTGMGDLTNTAALLSPLGNYGGTMLTHALLPGSPAINAGTATGAPTTDQRGSARFGATDIGAFESQGFTLSFVSGSPQSATVNTAFALPLKVSIAANNASEPVNGGAVTFTPPSMGASATIAGSPVAIASGMATTGTVTANSITGSYNVAASANGAASGVNFALTNTCQTIVVNNPGTNTGTVGAMFTATFTEMGGMGMTTFSTSSTLPAGLMLSSAGVLSGTPTQAGSFPITVTATDANGCTGASVGYTLTTACPAITVNPMTLPNGVAGTAYSQTITPGGGSSANYTYSFTGTLPPGLSLTPGPAATGTLSGNPTASGNYNFTIIATDTNGCAGNRAYSVTINQAPAITSANTVTFSINVLGSFMVTTTGFPTVTSTMQSGALPANVMFTDNGNGTATLSGTPQPGTAGNYPLTFTATNGVSPNAVQNFTLVVTGLVCPSTLTVNNLGDAGDANPGDGICATGGGVCTLRAAIEEANAIPACTPLTINFSVTGMINLATALPALNHPNLTITGPGASSLDVHRNVVTAFRIFTVNSGKTVNISGLTISNGNANDGGGIQNNGTLSVDGCVLANNQGGGNGGGGIANTSQLNVNNCSFISNSGALAGGGLLQINGGTAVVTNSTFTGNSAQQGGAIANQGVNVAASMTLTNCTISGNTATTFAAGVTNVASGATTTLTMTNCTVSGNTAPSNGGVRTGVNSGTQTFTYHNNIFSGNSSPNVLPISGTNTSLGNNLSSDGTGGGGPGDLLNTNPLLAALGNYGGPTQTHALLPGSPAINAGNNTGAPATDQRGILRPQQTTTDIGAFESRGFTLAIISGNNQTTP
ncbi:MAG: Ig domain-containing protein, partial [Acidobacteriota bacterium]